MSDVSLANLSARGSVIFTIGVMIMMLFTEPRELARMIGWRGFATGASVITIAAFVALTWSPALDAPWYLLPVFATLFYVTLLWGLFQRSIRLAAEDDARNYKKAWQRATDSWQACELRAHEVQNPPPPPADPDQLVLNLHDKQPFMPLQRQHRLRQRKRELKLKL